ncbi:UNVERIFIED_CONTAM: hypothetical protein NCL1_43183 [Trichonephila clavipes]
MLKISKLILCVNFFLFDVFVFTKDVCIHAFVCYRYKLLKIYKRFGNLKLYICKKHCKTSLFKNFAANKILNASLVKF